MERAYFYIYIYNIKEYLHTYEDFRFKNYIERRMGSSEWFCKLRCWVPCNSEDGTGSSMCQPLRKHWLSAFVF